MRKGDGGWGREGSKVVCTFCRLQHELLFPEGETTMKIAAGASGWAARVRGCSQMQCRFS